MVGAQTVPNPQVSDIRLTIPFREDESSRLPPLASISSLINPALNWQGENLKLGLAELFKAFQCAANSGCDVWQFALKYDVLQGLGLTETDLRWLAAKGYIEQAREITRRDHEHRIFCPAPNMLFSKQTCFVLTQLGISFTQELFDGAIVFSCPQLNMSRRVTQDFAKERDVPNWDPARHDLRYRGQLIKQFKWPAVNQEIILTTFEEDSWPPQIDDPLPPHPGVDPKRRLNNTIKSLNRRQKAKIIHFRGDGTGEGLVWEFVDPSHNGRSPHTG